MNVTDKFAGQIRVSASRIKSLSKCSYKFYLNEIEKLPETTHPKTIVGSICHSIFECLKRPRHRKYYDTIVKTGTLNGTPFKRLVKMWQTKHNIDQVLINDIDAMIMVALKHTDFYHKNATKIFDPEHEFKMELKTGIVKGFIDDMAFFETGGKIRDYKSQKEKFTKKELESEMQATIYQLYVWKKFNIFAEVEFVMLRHAPTPKHPTLHLQVVPPKTAVQLKGFEIYLEHMGTVFKNFGLDDAYADFAADDPRRKSFCEYVCQFKNPFEYQCVTKDGALVKNYFLNDSISLKEGEKLEIRKHLGCPKFNSIS
jgi:hypothetical protein